MGYFYWLCVKNPNYFHTELSLGYLKDTKFYLESKASFIHISSIASFNKGGKFLKKLWCCVGEEYNKIIWFYQLG